MDSDSEVYDAVHEIGDAVHEIGGAVQDGMSDGPPPAGQSASSSSHDARALEPPSSSVAEECAAKCGTMLRIACSEELDALLSIAGEGQSESD